ncbi:MAG: enoyl-CoA hydratase/isomerase family protein [Lewinellaceae bacterium]|nr:enoyl-CoA hydratase/isomerase family protein [Saprospiraceae bacterium]MCB9341010.1 enoyl-CoA hydratase/isomerase family protein [Lewinellaceae bacterium]
MENIRFNIEDAIGSITLHRPQVYNSFNRQMALEVQKALDLCRDDPSVRAIYLTGSGKAFCAGQDLQEVSDFENSPSFTTILGEHYNPIIQRLRSIEKPIVCAVNGVAAGAGANIAFACDITVAAESAAFIQAFSKIGLIPDSGGTFILPRLVGWQKAAALMMLGEKVSAKEAEAMGMIYKTLPDEGFAASAYHIAQTLAQMPTKGLAYTKHLLNRSLINDLESQLREEDSYQTLAGNTYDYKEGVKAFLEKRKPVFKGE